MNTLSPGATLQNGKYRIERVLGQGGFGITYLATQPLMLDRKVCIKEFFLKDYFSREATTSHVTCATESTREMTQTYRRKFIKEAQIQLQMHHESLVEVYDIFEENDTAYYAMEFIEGESLLEMVKHRGALPEAEAVGYIRQVADALAFIHSHQIAHLDVKPGNILIDKNGVAKLIDFGTSKHYDAKTGTQTTIATPCYSPGYAPIEQYKTGGLSTFSPESDVYSLGATLYKLVTGQTPPEPSEIVSDGLPELPGSISLATKAAIKRAMAVSSKNRPHTMKDFVAIASGQETIAVASTPKSKPINEEATRFVSEPVQPKQSTTSQTIQKPKEKEGVIIDDKPKEENHSNTKSWWIPIIVIGVMALLGIIANSDSIFAEPLPYSLVNVTYNLSNGPDELRNYTYSGDFVVSETGDYIPNGEGNATYSNGAKFHGIFKNGLPNGNGRIEFSNGDYYEGSWKNGYYNRGTYKIKTSGEEFQGSFKNGNPWTGNWYDKHGRFLDTVTEGK